MTCKATYAEMQRDPGAWHPSVSIFHCSRFWEPGTKARAAALLAWLDKHKPRLSRIECDTLDRMGVHARANWSGWPIVARCAGTRVGLSAAVCSPAAPPAADTHRLARQPWD